MPGTAWTTADAGNLGGRVALVTGANSGLGFETAKVLLQHGATVVIAGRDPATMSDAAARLRVAPAQAALPRGQVATPLQLDLAALDSVRTAAAAFLQQHDRLDLLINNAGVMGTPYGLTADGFELQLGINHLGHFALTGLLLERLLSTPHSRVVTVSSLWHRRAVIDFDDLQSEHRYQPMDAYGRSKLANLLFTYELQRRLAGSGSDTIATAAHPGAARTALVRHSPWFYRLAAGPRARLLSSWFIQGQDAGALPTLRAATDPAARGGEYYGPDGWREMTGRHPIRVRSSPLSRKTDVQRRLWQESERLTGIRYTMTARGTAAQTRQWPPAKELPADPAQENGT